MEVDMEHLELYKKEATRQYDQLIEIVYLMELKKIFRWFGKKFPKRRLRWVSGVGTFFWELDGEIFDCDVYVTDYVSTIGRTVYLKERGWTRKQILLKPLVDFYKSISDTTNYLGSWIDIGDWETKPKEEPDGQQD